MADPITVLSLCSGIGALDLAVGLACPGARVVAYAEREAHSAAVLLARMADQTLEPAPVWCGNIEELDASLFAGVGMVTAGFPCQPWSGAGKRLGVEDDRWLWPLLAGVVRTVGPRYVFLENVPPLLVVDGAGAVLGDLAEMGFDAEWGVLPASAAGAPHQRERVYVLAYPGRDGRPGLGAAGDVAGSAGEAEGEARQREWGGNAAGHGGEDVANADHDGRARLGREPGDDRDARDDAHRPGRTPVGDADRQRQQQPHHQDRADARQRPRDGACRAGGGLALFPPGPAALDEWAEVLRTDPTLEPSLRRLADGPPARLDRYDDPTRTDQLRALGNSVVPQAAALALTLLAERAGVTL